MYFWVRLSVLRIIITAGTDVKGVSPLPPDSDHLINPDPRTQMLSIRPRKGFNPEN